MKKGRRGEGRGGVGADEATGGQILYRFPFIKFIVGVEIGRSLPEASWAKNARPSMKNNESKKGLGVIQIIECLPTKCKALSSNLSTDKKDYK
jgi:hypothetical protein